MKSSKTLEITKKDKHKKNLMFLITSIDIGYIMGSRLFGSQSPNNSQYLVNGESYEKSALNKRDVKFNFLSKVLHQI